MRNELALRFLLLRHFQRFRKAVSEDVFLEVSRSLHVNADKLGYKINWIYKGQPRSKEYMKTDFLFYKRGDTNSNHRTVQDSLKNNNNEMAKAFAIEALSISNDNYTDSSVEPLEQNTKFYIAESIAFVMTMMFFGGIGYLSCLLLLLMLLIEFFQKGRLFCAGLFLPFAMFDLQGAVFLGAMAYAALQFLDPNFFNRNIRISLSISASIIALALGLTGRGMAFSVDWVFIILFLSAFPISFIRSLVSVHFRAMPLALPFFCAGLALNNQISAAIVGIIFCTLTTTVSFFLYKLTPPIDEHA